MRDVFLSIVIPVYNSAAYLPQCLDSILSSGVADMEIILSDDGSTDGSSLICERYSGRHPFVRWIRQENRGPSAARNAGLDSACGKYIAFFDSDDYVDGAAFFQTVDKLKNAVDRAEAAAPEIWISDFHRVADNGTVLDHVYQINSDEPVIGRDYFSSYLSAKDCIWNVWRYIFLKRFLSDNALLFCEGYNIAEDLEFVVNAIKLCRQPAFCHIPYYNYRVNYGTTLTRSYSSKRVLQLMVMLERARSHLKNDDLSSLINSKLAREYILNLTLMYEVPVSERQVSLQYLKAAKRLSSGAAGVYSVVSKLIDILGIPAIAAVLLVMKRLKRYVRKLKTQRFFKSKW